MIGSTDVIYRCKWLKIGLKSLPVKVCESMITESPIADFRGPKLPLEFRESPWTFYFPRKSSNVLESPQIILPQTFTD